MPAPLGNPVFYWATPAGAPAVGYQVFTYAAGTSTPQAAYPTFTDANNGTSPLTNPVILDANGSAQIWLSNAFYKIVLETDLGVTVWTIDNVSGSGGGGGGTAPTSEWLTFPANPTYISATSFSVVGDQRATFGLGRRLKSTNTAGTIYSTVTAVAFSTNTTVTVVNDSGSLDSGLVQIFAGILQAQNTSQPVRALLSFNAANNLAMLSNTPYSVIGSFSPTKLIDTLNEWNATSRYTPTQSGFYRVYASLNMNNNATGMTNGTGVMAIYKNSTLISNNGLLPWTPGATQNTSTLRGEGEAVVYLIGNTDTILVQVTSPTFSGGTMSTFTQTNEANVIITRID